MVLAICVELYYPFMNSGGREQSNSKFNVCGALMQQNPIDKLCVAQVQLQRNLTIKS